MGSVSSLVKPEVSYFDGGLQISELLLAVLWEGEKTNIIILQLKIQFASHRFFLLEHV